MSNEQLPETVDDEQLQEMQADQNPATILAQAVQSGVSADAIGQLADLYERFADRQAKQAFDTAYAQLQADIPSIPHDKEAGRGNFSYTYASLDKVKEVVKPKMEKHGMSYRFDTHPRDGGMEVECILTHVGGHSESSTVFVPIDGGKMNDIQKYGSSQSYGKRYALEAALGISTTEDDDAQSAGKPHNGQPQQKPNPPKQKPKTKPNRITPARLKKLHAVGRGFYGDNWDEKRHELVKSITNGRTESSKKLTNTQGDQLIDGIQSRINQSNNDMEITDDEIPE